MLRKIRCKLKRKLSNWWWNLWFNEMSREFAVDMDRASQHGIDFGPEPIGNILKYWCRDHHRKPWHRFFINWRQFDMELEHLAFVRSYE